MNPVQWLNNLIANLQRLSSVPELSIENYKFILYEFIKASAAAELVKSKVLIEFSTPTWEIVDLSAWQTLESKSISTSFAKRSATALQAMIARMWRLPSPTRGISSTFGCSTDSGN